MLNQKMRRYFLILLTVFTTLCEGVAESVVELKQKVEALRETIQQQRSQLRTLQHDVSDKNCSIAAVSCSAPGQTSCQGSHASWKVLDFFLDFPGAGKS